MNHSHQQPTLEHIVKFEPGYDCVVFECKFDSAECAPNKGGSHGRNTLAIRFVSKGERGAVQFLLWTGWLPQRSSADSIGYRSIPEWSAGGPNPADLGYHSKTQMHADQTAIDSHCEYCDGQPCYYDGSGLNASDAMYALVNGGDEALWEFLDSYYETVFNGAAYPAPAEYPKKLRAAYAALAPHIEKIMLTAYRSGYADSKLYVEEQTHG